MRKLLTAGGVIVLFLGLLVLATRYFAQFSSVDPTHEDDFTQTLEPMPYESDFTTNLETQRTTKRESASINYQVESVLQNLEIPWGIVFTSPNRMLISERAGRVRVAESGDGESWRLTAKPLHTFSNISSIDEDGLMGMALDPNYSQNKYVYFCYAYPDGSTLKDRVVRLVDAGDEMLGEQVLLDKIPSAKFHAGCELKFGPDGKLYVSTGDATQPKLAQDTNSLAGKILRINTDGSVPEDNPFPGSPIYSLGHRNPQGFDWYPGTQIMFASEHGPSGFDGPGGGDEINLIEKGKNYGWPEVSHEQSQPGMVDPKLVFTPAIAPSGLVFYTGGRIADFNNDILIALLGGEGILRVVLDENNPTQVLWYERLDKVQVGRVRKVVVGPDGYLYFATSNMDQRGPTPAVEDDQIFRIVAE